VPVIGNLGATLNFAAGKVNRAPMWMQRCGLEWLHRLTQEPRRLATRYVSTNSRFVWRMSGRLAVSLLRRARTGRVETVS